MTNRHLFRGKRVESGEWVEGYYYAQGGAHFIIDADYYHNRVDPATVGQCAGLKDANGALIYEGDIVNTIAPAFDLNKKGCVKFGAHKNINAPIDYTNGDLGFYIEWAKNIRQLLRSDIIFWQGNGYIEVVGNVHDNPELLETDK